MGVRTSTVILLKGTQATFCANEKRKLPILGAIKRAENSVQWATTKQQAYL
jgi:hypothetical protein